jgi:hypothetical protein
VPHYATSYSNLFRMHIHILPSDLTLLSVTVAVSPMIFSLLTTYSHPFVAFVCKCSIYIWRADIHWTTPIPMLPANSEHNSVAVIFITRENTLLFTCSRNENKTDFKSTSVFSMHLRPAITLLRAGHDHVPDQDSH